MQKSKMHICPTSHSQEFHKNPTLTSYSTYAEDLAQTLQSSEIATSVQGSPYVPCLLDSVDPVLLVTLISLTSAPFSAVLSKLCIMFGCDLCICSHQFLDEFSDDNYSRLWSMSIAGCHQESFFRVDVLGMFHISVLYKLTKGYKTGLENVRNYLLIPNLN